MSDNFHYQSDDYGRQSQRFVIPLYTKDKLENYSYSSTGTLVKYNGHHYIIFAAHALADNDSFENIYTFFKNGGFYKIKDSAIGYKIFNDEDIVLVDYFNSSFDNKNYFDLNQNSLLGVKSR